MKAIASAVIFLASAFGAFAQLLTNLLVADFDARFGVTTNASGFVSSVASQVGSISATQATDGLKPKLLNYDGRLGWYFHWNTAGQVYSNLLVIGSGLTNHTRGMSWYWVAEGQVRSQSSSAFGGAYGYGAPILIAQQGGTTLRKTLQSGTSTTGTIKIFNNVAVYGASCGPSGVRVWQNLESEVLPALASAATAGGQIGGMGGSYPFNGVMFRVLVYNKEHSQAESEQVINALVEEHDIVTVHSAVIVAVGDSNSEGYLQTNNSAWPVLLARRFPSWRWVNAAWSGRQIGSNGVASTHYTDHPNQVDPYYNASVPSWLLQAGGVNDIIGAALTGDLVYLRHTNWAAARKAAAGWKIGAVTIPALNYQATAVSNLNARLRLADPTRYDFVSDSGYQSPWSPLQSSANTNYHWATDTLHITPAAHQIVADSLASNLLAHVDGTFYVATNGSDLNPGTVSAPFLTLQKAVTSAQSGDVVVVQPGNYPDRWQTVRDGTSNAPITIRGIGMPSIGAVAFTNHWLTLDGFSCRGSNYLYAAAITFRWSAGNITVTNCTFEETSASIGQVSMTSGQWGVAPVNITLISNRFIHTKYYGIGTQGRGHRLIGNWMTSTNGGDAVYVGACNTLFQGFYFTNWSRPEGSSQHTDLFQGFSNNGEIATNVVFRENFAIDCNGTQIGNVSDDFEFERISRWYWLNNIFIDVEAVITLATPYQHWFGNLFVQSGRNTAAPLMYRKLTTAGEGQHARMFNNIWVECGSNPANPILGWYALEGDTASTALSDYNLVLGSGAGTVKTGFVSGGREAHSLNGVDPMFVDRAGLDFRPATGSPLVGAGVDVSSYQIDEAFFGPFNVDFTGATRSGAWTIGPFQVASSGGGGGGGGGSPAPGGATVTTATTTLNVGTIQ